MKINKIIATSVLLAMVFSSVSCSKTSNPDEANKADFGYIGNHKQYYGGEIAKYTKEDYDFLKTISLQDLANISVYDFNNKYLNQSNEDEYHKNEKMLERLYQSLPETDSLYDFLNTTVYSSWVESEKEHYNKCEKNANPHYSDSESIDTYEDVYGNKVLTQQISFDITFNYKIVDSKTCSVLARDEILKSVGTTMKSFIEKQNKQDLYQDNKMKSVLLEELNRILSTLSNEIQWAGDSDIYYWMYDSEEEAKESAIIWNEKKEFDYSKKYTAEQYNQLIQAVVLKDYESMSIADFDRTIYNLFDEETEDYYKSNYFLYEYILNHLDEKDPNYNYLRYEIPLALNEYEAKEQEVLTKKETNVNYGNYSDVVIKGKVYEDDVIIDQLSLFYEIEYRVLNGTECTVKERNEFLTQINKAIYDYIQNNYSNKMTEKQLLEEFKAIGNKYSNDKISFENIKIEGASTVESGVSEY